MRIEAVYSHLNGLEWLQVQRPGYWQEIRTIIGGVNAAKHKTKESKEKTKKGRLVYSPRELNAAFAARLERKKWLSSTVRYWVTDEEKLIRQTINEDRDTQRMLIEAAGKRPIPSYNQTDFVKNRVAIEVQFGKYSFISYDLFVKHLAFYVGDQIDCGIEILPMKCMQEEMSSGPGYYEGALYDVVRQGRGVPAVPLILVGVAP
jgi:hypothetical protein